MKHSTQPYLLKLTAGRIPPIAVWLIISLLQVLFTVLTFVIEEIPITYGNIYVSAYFTFTFGYVVYISRVIHQSHSNSFKKLLHHPHLSDENREKWQTEFGKFRNMWPETLIAVGVGVVLAYQYLANAFEQNDSLAFYYYWRALEVVIIWVLITQSTSLFMRNTTIMNRMSRDIPIDLINLDELMPLTKAGITSTLAFIGAYSFLFINGVNITDLDNPALIVLVPSIIVLLARPLKGVRKRVVDAKKQEIALIDRAIDGDMQALESSRLQKNLDNLNAIDLINYKKLIENTREIPLNIPTASRFIFYLVIPFLTWVAASVVDKVIDHLLSSAAFELF